MGGMPGAVWPGRAWLPVGWLVGWIASRVLRRKPVNLDAFMAVFRIDDPSDELIFEFEPAPASESGEGFVVGEYETNGAMVLETDSCGVIWPTYNPRRPVTPDRPK